MANNQSNDRTMARSIAQAMYRYLPGRWIDFYIKSSRTSYSAFVSNWNSEKISDVNKGRIKRTVWERLSAFEGFTRDFAPLYDDAAWSVMTPKVNDQNAAVISEVSPLMFFCSSPACRKITQFSNSSTFLRDPRNTKCKHCATHAPLTQVRMIYYCDCGWAAPVESPRCSNGCKAPLIQKSTYVQVCSRCSKEYEMYTFCPDCNKMVFPRNALDNAQFYVQSLHIIDLVNQRQEQFLTEDTAGRYLAIAYWLGYIPRENLEEAVQYGLYKQDQDSVEEQLQQRIQILRETMPGLPEDMYLTAAKQMHERVDSPTKDIDTAIERAKNLLTTADEAFLLRTAIAILEYDTILYPREERKLEEAAKIGVDLNTIHDESIYTDAAQSLHFSHVQASGCVPFVTAVYGYTRKSNIVKDNTRIRAFARENAARSNIYATRMETEGVLFELDRRAVLKWLISNQVVSEVEYSENMGDDELKAWFISHCDSSNIPVYGEIDPEINPVLSAVYKLIHTISHSIIRQAAAISGLDKNSLSEYIFCHVPAVFIYCQNSQGFNLGAMFSALESQFDVWMSSMLHEVAQCVFDPVCIDEDGACSGCLFLNDISCTHFNQDLDRKLLIGHRDAETGAHFVGFWE